MNLEEEKIKNEAEDFARRNKKIIAKECSDLFKYPPEKNPVSVFMAGSPGAGKTEASKWLIKELTGREDSIIRIDPDELRLKFNSYNGKNSFLFQQATTFLAEKIHDMAIKNYQSFIFDTTFSRIDKAITNIDRSLGHKRSVQILYVYQEPIQAWNFVKERELKEGRHIPKDSFIEEYFKARLVVNEVKRRFPEIKIHLLIKNIDGSTQEYYENIDNIDNYVKEKYTVETLNKILI